MITKHAQIAKKLPSWFYKAGAQLFIDKRFPRHLFIETTASCNLNCSYCPREKVNKHMDWELFKRIVNEAAHYGPRSFSLHLFGEPLLYPKWQEAVRYIKEKDKQNTVLLTSNGTLFERYIDDLVVSPVDRVLWSWRPEAKWSEKTVAKLKSWKPFTVRIIDDVTPEWAKERYLKWPRVERRRLHNYGGNIQLTETQSTQMSTRWPCYHLWLAPAVAWNGKFLMCCADPHQKEVFGDLTKESVNGAWQRVERVRQSHLKGEYSGICENCDVWKAYPDIFFGWQKK